MQSECRVFHVKPEGGRWRVWESGDAAPEVYDSEAEAVEAGKKLAQAHGPATLRIERSDGSVESEIQYGKDPLVTQLEKFGF